MELESYDDGVLLHIGIKDGESVPVNGIIAVIGKKGEDITNILKEAENNSLKKEENKEEVVEEIKEEIKEEEVIEKVSSNGRIKASPLAKKLAQEKGINLKNIQGTGEGGRITKKDIESLSPDQSNIIKEEITLPKIVAKESFDEVPVSQMRKTISKRLAESKFTAPHFYLTMEINMDNCVEGRKRINESSSVKISFNDIILKACASALRKHPMVNSSLLDEKIRKNHHIHIGVAVAVDEGLLVPVIRFADNKTLSHISLEVKDLARKAKEKKLQSSDWEGNTFTISNLGMFGIEEFTAIINPNDSCILAIGGIKETPIVKDGEMVAGNMMKVTMSCDHRLVDGATGAAFLQTLKELLEDPIKILV